MPHVVVAARARQGRSMWSLCSLPAGTSLEPGSCCLENSHRRQIRPDIYVRRSQKGPKMPASAWPPRGLPSFPPAAWTHHLGPVHSFHQHLCQAWGLAPSGVPGCGGGGGDPSLTTRELRPGHPGVPFTPRASHPQGCVDRERQSHTRWQTPTSCLPPLGLSFQTSTAG